MTRTLTLPSQVSSSPCSVTTNRSPRTSSSNGSPNTELVRPRHNGFERPFSRDQVISWIGHSVSALCFFIGAMSISVHCTGQESLDNTDTSSSTVTVWTFLAVAVHVVNSTILVASWRFCETIDPAAHRNDAVNQKNGWWCVRLSGPRWEKTRYCALCRKTVPGMDHHCTWLQTCIGKANYVQFFTVACTGTVQFVLQVAYAILCLLWLHAHPMKNADVFGYLAKCCFVLCSVISVPCMFMYFVLVGFHLWLMVLGYGTYDWMLRRRQEQRAKLEARKMNKHAANGDTSESSFASTRQPVTLGPSSHAAIIVEDVKLEERGRELTML
uniref:Palmitoyltransferase n=1 Tax=Peronospora matthiolae TaxID=2874970 RepID=A0AAV1UUX2_9STRA